MTAEKYDTTADLLSLVSPWPAHFDVQVRALVSQWTYAERAVCDAWAGALHLRASDNDDIYVPIEPAHVFELRSLVAAWRGDPSEVTRMAALPTGLSGKRVAWHIH